MSKLTTLVIAALLPTLAYAQPAAPTAADRTAMAVILNQIITLQQQQLAVLQQLPQQFPLDGRHACIFANQSYSEGAPIKAVDGKIYVCLRVSPTTAQDHERYMWAPAT